MKKFLFDCGTRDATASFGIFVLRVSLGLMMIIGHGMMKLQNFGTLSKGWFVPDFFPLKYMSPPVSLMATIGAEVIAAGMIVFGLATRPAAFVLGFAMVIAAFDASSSLPFFIGASPSAKEPAVLYLLFASVILLTGAGSWSLDSRLCKEGKRRRW